MALTETKPPALETSPPAAKSRPKLRPKTTPWLFLAPFLLVLTLFLVVPILSGLYMSFTGANLAGSDQAFVGFANYFEAFADAEVWRTLGHTLLFTVLSTIPLVGIGLLMAVLANMGLPGRWLWRFTFFAPFLMPVATVALIWQWMFQPDFGLLNSALNSLGLDSVGWLVDQDVALLSIVLTTVWWTVGFNFLLYLSALQAIPEQLYDAASIDGAGSWRTFFSITLPLLNRTTGLVIILQVLASLKVFDQVYIMTQGGPNGATRPILEYVYDVGFTGFRLGYASAISYIFFALIVIVALIQMAVLARKGAKS